MIFKNFNLEQNEFTTFKFHFSYSIIEGIIVGFLVLNQYELDFVDSFKIENYIFFAGFKGEGLTPGLKELIIRKRC